MLQPPVFALHIGKGALELLVQFLQPAFCNALHCERLAG